jgi:hypothetical protein
MYACKDDIASVFVVTETKFTNSFIGKVPNGCIKDEVDKKWAEEFVDVLKGRSELYRTANNLKNLKQLFSRIMSAGSESRESAMIAESDKYADRIRSRDDLSPIQRRRILKEIEDDLEHRLRLLYKTEIRRSILTLEGMDNDLTDEEICCRDYLDFNPRTMLILDDCASKFKAWVRKIPAIKDMFYYGRHYFLTLIITAQDDTEIDGNLRKNVGINIFTSARVANAHFSRKTDAYPKDTIQKATMCSNAVFSEAKDRHHRKLIYMNNVSGNPFFYTVATPRDPYTIGSAHLRELDRKIEQNNKPKIGKYIKRKKR